MPEWFEIWCHVESDKGEHIYLYIDTTGDYTLALEICEQNKNYEMRVKGKRYRKHE